MKTAEKIYEEATLKSLSENANGTRMDVIYLAMKMYAEQAVDECAKSAAITYEEVEIEDGLTTEVIIVDRDSILSVKSELK